MVTDNSCSNVTLMGLCNSLHYLRTNTHAKSNTHVKPRPGRKSSAPQRERNPRSGSLKVPRYKAPGAGQSHHSSPGCHRTPGAFFSIAYVRVCWDADKEWRKKGRHKLFPSFLFFFHMHRTAFCSPFFFSLWGKGVLVWITWLQFTWDKTKEAKKAGERRHRIRQRDALMVRIPLSQSTLMDKEKSGDFGVGCQFVAWRRYKGSLLWRTALVFVSVRPITSPLVSPFCIFYQYCLVLNARCSVTVS